MPTVQILFIRHSLHRVNEPSYPVLDFEWGRLAFKLNSEWTIIHLFLVLSDHFKNFKFRQGTFCLFKQLDTWTKRISNIQYPFKKRQGNSAQVKHSDPYESVLCLHKWINLGCRQLHVDKLLKINQPQNDNNVNSHLFTSIMLCYCHEHSSHLHFCAFQHESFC